MHPGIHHLSGHDLSVDKNINQFPCITGLWKLEERETQQSNTDTRKGGEGGQETINSERILYLTPVPGVPLGSRVPTGGLKCFLRVRRGLKGLKGREASFHCWAGT